MPAVPADWKIPPAFTASGDFTSETRRLGSLKEAKQQGESYLKSQRPYSDINRAFDIISGAENDRRPKSLSRTKFSLIKRGIREIVAIESDIRQLSGFHTDNRDYFAQARVLNKLIGAWHFNTFADQAMKKIFQWGAVGGTGYGSLVWEKDYWTFGRGDIVLKAYGPHQVVPTQVSSDHNLQRTYIVTLVVETPIAEALNKYPALADRIVPTRANASWTSRAAVPPGKFRSPALNLAGPSKKGGEPGIFPTVDINHSYIIDPSINDSGHDIPMGDSRWSWHYIVPALGADIQTKIKENGVALVRKATEEDCLLYPLRRLVIWTDTCVIYDGTSWAWDGKVPLFSFQPDSWPWEFLGYSLVHDADPMERSHTNAMRAIDDAANVRLRPPIQYDRGSVSKAFMDRFDPRQPGQTMGVDLLMGEPIKPIMDPRYFDTPPWMLEYCKMLRDGIEYSMGIKDLTALMRARQVPAFESIEKLQEAGPLVVDIGRSIEYMVREMAEMWKARAFQFYNANRIFQIVGEAGMVEEMYDYEPGNMIPSHMPGEDKKEPSAYGLVERAKLHLNSFFYQTTPNTTHNIVQQSKRLMLLQLYIRGFPIDPWTIAKACEIKDFGPEPEGAVGVFGKWIEWMRAKGELAGELGGAQQQAPVGRKPSGMQPPHQAQRTDGSPIITQSK